jgi:glycerol-3-phosphate O-acyltransferase
VAIDPAFEARLADHAPERFAGIDDRRVLNETGMLARPSWLVRIFMWLAFRKVGFEERHAQTVRDLEREGDVVYVMNHHSVLDYLYFNYALSRRGLPLAFVANTISTMLFFRPLWAIILHGLRRLVGYYRHRLEPHERVAYALSRQRASLVFLKTRTIWPWASAEAAGNSFLETVLAAQLERMVRAAREGGGAKARPISIVPQLLIWVHDPERHKKSFWQQVFGNPEAPSRLRKILNFLLNRRRAFVRVGKPIDVGEFCERHRDVRDLEALSVKLRAEVLRNLSLEERVIKGPVLKSGRDIREEILANPEVETAMAAMAKELAVPEERIKKEVSGYLKEMAADFSMLTIEMTCIIMTLVFNRIYHEIVIDQDGLEKVREAARKSPLVLLPCHRSHIDYLVLSYIFYTNGLIPPHIAAGSNLNFFPVGRLFRRAGAFFIRRSFKDNKGYTLAFREYLKKLVQEGYWIEFFIEGGRSRTGKMLAPKFGVLKVIVDAIKSGAAPDMHFVPVYVGYEQVIEEKAFSRELGGGEKKKENFGALLSATKVLWAKYGRLYVNFGEPISCREALARFEEQQAKHNARQTGRQHDPDNLFLRRLGYRVSDAINKVAMVTPSALVAAALLFHGKRGISRDTLLARVGLMLEIAVMKNARLSKTIEDGMKRHRDSIAEARAMMEKAGMVHLRFALGESSPLARARGIAIEAAIDESLKRMVKVKHVEAHVFDEETIYVPITDARINLDFYKNNIVHLFIAEAIIAAAIRGTLERGVTNAARVMEAAAFLSRTFQYEFIFDPEKGFASQFVETLGRFDQGGLIARVAGEDFSSVEIRIPESGANTMELLHRALAPWIEAYWLIAEALEFHAEEPLPEAKFIALAQDLGKRRYQVGDISCPESASNVNFQHALSAWEEFGLIERSRKGREKLIAATKDPDDPQRMHDLRRRLRDLFP